MFANGKSGILPRCIHRILARSQQLAARLPDPTSFSSLMITVWPPPSYAVGIRFSRKPARTKASIDFGGATLVKNFMRFMPF